MSGGGGAFFLALQPPPRPPYIYIYSPTNLSLQVYEGIQTPDTILAPPWNTLKPRCVVAIRPLLASFRFWIFFCSPFSPT